MPFFNSAKVLTNSYSLGSVSELFGKKLLSSSNEPGTLDRAMSKSSKDFEFSVERKFKKSESSGNGMLAFSVSDSNGGSSKEKTTSIAHGLNQGVKKCSSQIIQEANDSLKSNYKLQQSPDFLDLDFMNKEAEVNGSLRSDSSFMLKTGSSISHNGSFCSSDQGQPETVPKIQTASCFAQSLKTTEAKTQSRNFQSMQTWLTSKNTQPSSISQSKVEEQLVQFCCSEREDQVNILQDIDELKFELQRLFTKTADGNAASGFSIKVTHFKGKVPSEKHQSSIIPFPGEPKNTLYGNCKSCRERQILRLKHGRPQTVKHHCRPFLGGAPFVICSRCYKLLQLPADFLLSTKRVHRLRCGFCSEVLKYTFRPRTRSAPHISSLEHVICKDENTSPSGEAWST